MESANESLPGVSSGTLANEGMSMALNILTVLSLLAFAQPLLACDLAAESDKYLAISKEYTQVKAEYKKHKDVCPPKEERYRVTQDQLKRSQAAVAALKESDAAKQAGDNAKACSAMATAQDEMKANLTETKALIAKCTQ